MSVTRSSPVQVAGYSNAYSQTPKLVSANWYKVSVGSSHVLALSQDSKLWAWGINTDGQLGLGDVVTRSSPVQVGNPAYTWKDIHAGNNFSVGLRGDGLLFVWGINSVGQLGDLNTGTTSRSSPIQIGTSSWTAIAAGGSHIVAIRSDTTLWSWGSNSAGQLGNGDYASRSSPVQIGTLKSWTSISAGNLHTAAIDKTGRLYTWGNNPNGELGYNTTATIQSWAQVAGNADYSIAIRNDGMLFAWGTNNLGQLGTNDTINRSSPVQIGTNSWTNITANAPTGGGPVLAVRADGTLWSWGYNVTGVLGLGDTVYRSSPVQVGTGTSWSKVSASKSHSLALDTTGALYGVGLGTSGQIPTIYSWTQLAAGSAHTVAIRNDGKLFTWGYGVNGQLGDGTVATRSNPVQIGNSSWLQVAAGNSHTLAIDAAGRLFAWGTGSQGELGTGDTVLKNSPVQVTSVAGSWSQISVYGYCAVGVTTLGQLYAWGYNASGEVGDGTVTPASGRSAPTQIGTQSSWTQVASGDAHKYAITTTGALWGWGFNGSGQLGLGNATSTSSPVLISSSSYTMVAGGGSIGFFIDINGKLWSTGTGTNNANGIGSTVNTLTQIAVGSSFTMVSASYDFAFAITTSKTLFGWGNNTYSQLGDGTTNSRLPTLVTPGSWNFVTANSTNNGSSAFGIQNSTKYLYGWGSGVNGILGDNTTTSKTVPALVYGQPTLSRSTPVQLMAGQSFSQISAGDLTSYAIKSDGSLWSWGAGTAGAVGDNNTLSRSSPTQLGTYSWTNVYAYGAGYVHAIRNDGALYGWGLGTTGQLGYNQITSRSSPVQVAAGSWTSLASYGTTPNTLGIKSDGSLWAWGSKTNLLLNEFGNATFTYSWSQISTGPSHTAAIRNDGRLFTWGLNSVGQLGLTDTTNRNVPTQVNLNAVEGELWSCVSVNGLKTTAIRSDGTLWTWGDGTNYSLTDLSGPASRSAPMQVTTNTGNALAFDASTRYLQTNSSTSYGMGTGDFTIEFWIWSGSNNRHDWVDINSGTTRILVYYNGAGVLAYYATSPTNNTQVITSSGFPQWQWAHIALSRKSGVSKLFANGSQIGGTYADTNNFGTSSTVYIGKDGSGSTYVNGFMSNIRIIKGTGLYTDNFTPPTSPLTAVPGTVLLINSSTIIDSSSVGATITNNGSTPVLTEVGPFILYTKYKSVATGISHVVAVTDTGKLIAWGDNTYNQLGDNTSALRRTMPAQIGSDSYAQVSSLGNHTLALKSDGTLWAWGENAWGQIGNGSALSWKQVAAAQNNTIYLRSDGLLFAWGVNTNGELGFNDRTGRNSPTQLGTSSWTMIVSRANTFAAIKADGTLWLWGLNPAGMLGTNDVASRSSPVQVSGGGSWISVMASISHTVAIKNDYTMYTWGLNSDGQLGDNTTVSRSTPVQVGAGTSWIDVEASSGISAALSSTKKLWMWGKNTAGVLGDGTTISRSKPVQIGNDNWYQITADALGIKEDRTLWSWGDASAVGIGLGQAGAAYSRSSPVQIGIGYSWKFASFNLTGQCYMIRQDDTLFGWGYNTAGELGLNDVANRSSPVQIGTSTFSAIWNSAGSVYAYTTDGRYHTWGIGGNYNLLADLPPSTATRSSPVQVSSSNAQISSPVQIGTKSWIAISAGLRHSLAVDTSYSLFAWGDNNYSQIGHTTPATILSTSNNENNNAAGYVRSDSALILWGPNDAGQLGDGTVVAKSSPVILAGADKTFIKVARAKLGSASHTLAIRYDGTLWAWGSNVGGKLGDGTTANRSSPVQIGFMNNWADVAAGTSHTLALKTDGTLWGWGFNTSGQAGTISWSKISSGSSHTLALRSDGQMFGWGSNTVGQVGDISIINRSSPVQIGSGFSWNQVSAGLNISVAIRGDNTLWAWGNNAAGALGQGDVISRSSPTQVSTTYVAQSWTQVSAYDYVLAVDSTSKIFGWGSNTNNLFGTGSTTNRTTPLLLTSINRYSTGYNGGSYLNVAPNASTALGSNDFTVEFWVFPTANGELWRQGTYGVDSVLYLRLATPSVTAGIQMTNLMPADQPQITGGTVTNNAWNHILFDRKFVSGQGKHQLYVNGVYIGTSDYNGGINWGNKGNVSWGQLPHILGGSTVGYISNYRLIIGQAIIDRGVNFTPSTTMLTTTTVGHTGSGAATTLTGTVKTLISPNVSTIVDSSISAATIYNSNAVQIGTFINSPFETYVSKVDAGADFALAIDSQTSNLWSWGINTFGQLGDGTTISRSGPVQIGSSSWSQISAGRGHGLAITTDGLLYVWGDNVYSQLGLSDTVRRSSPVQVGTSSWTNVYAGTNYSMASQADNTLWGWGDTTKGNLGIITALSWTSISAGTGIHNDYTLWTWGVNTVGQLGISSTAPRSSPVQIGSSSWSQVTSNVSNTYAITSDGKLWSWGDNTYGQLGDSTVVTKSSPVQITSVNASWSVVSTSGTGHALGLTTTGTLYAWGLNTTAQLGVGDVANRSAPVQVNASSWTKVSAGNSYSLAIRSDGALFSWGDNTQGQLGYSGLLSWVMTGNGIALSGDGKLYLWGNNTNGELGDPTIATTVLRSSPVQLGTSSWTTVGTWGGFAVRKDGTLWSWGLNNMGQLGLGDTINRSSPVQVGTDTDWLTANNSEHSRWAIKRDYRAFVWGRNNAGQLGLGDTIYRSAPVQLVGSWSQLAGTDNGPSFSAGGIRTDGTLWMWGANSNGQLGDLTVVDKSSPVQVSGGGSWTQLAMGIGARAFTIALKVGGTLFSWGDNAYGTLGSGTTVNRSSPVQVGTSTWVSIATASGSIGAAAAGVTSIFTLYTWGRGVEGQQGSGATTYRSAPTQVAGSSWTMVNGTYYGFNAATLVQSLQGWGAGPVGDNAVSLGRSAPTQIKALTGTWYKDSPTQVGTSSWTQVSAGDAHTFAVRTDGGLFTWGKNDNGQLGGPTTGSTVARSSPVQIGALSWTVVSAGASTGAAIDTLGRLFTWGLGTTGQLGSAAVTSRSSPVQVGTSSWTSVSASKDFMTGVDINKRLFAWGLNSSGQLGLGDTAQRSSPVQVGANYQTMYSNPTQITTAQGNSFSSYAGVFNGNNSYSIANDGTAMNLDTGDFTLECWVYSFSLNDPTETVGRTVVNYGTYVTEACFSISTYKNLLRFRYSNINSTGGGYLGPGVSIIPNTWYHVAIVRSSGVVYFYVNGVLNSSIAHAVSYNTASGLYVGSATNQSTTAPAYRFKGGYISNVRLVKGVAVYTGAFTPLNGQLQLTQSAGTNISAITAGQTVVLTARESLADVSGNNLSATMYGTPAPLLMAVTVGPNYYSYFVPAMNGVGESHNVLVAFDGSIYVTGDNTTGQLGDSSIVAKSAPVVTALPTLYDNRSSPAQIGTGSWSLITAGTNYSVAVQTDGTLWTWGDNTNGYLGDNTLSVTRSPKLIDDASNGSWSSISSGGSHTVAIKEDYTLWAWGLNNAGQLGNNDTANRSSPVQVNTLAVTSWAQVSAGASHTTGLDLTARTPYTWGLNSSGQLGDGTLTSKSVPTAVSTSTVTNYSIQFSGSSQNFISIADNPVLNFGTGTFTVEAWVYKTSALGQMAIFGKTGGSSSDIYLYIDNANTVTVRIGAVAYTTTFILAATTWYHVALTKDSNNDLRVFVDGVSSGVIGNNTANLTNTYAFTIGTYRATGSSLLWNGYISNFRVTKGAVLYTSGFYPSGVSISNTPNTSLLTAKSSTIIDTSTNALAITVVGTPTVVTPNPFTAYSALYNTTGYTIVNQSGTVLDFGADNFTIECFFYPVTVRSTSLWSYLFPNGVDQVQMRFYNYGSGTEPTLYNTASGSWGDLRLGIGSVVAGKWHHIATVKNNGTIYVYINGVLKNSTADNTSYSTTVGMSIGNKLYVPGATALNGYVSNFRVVKGVAVYTSNFAAPSSTLNASQDSISGTTAFTESQTVLLTLQSSTLVDSSTYALTLSNTLPTPTTALQPFGVSGSSSAFDNIQAGSVNTMGITYGYVYVWGAGTSGALGDNTTVTKSVPTLVNSVWSVAERTLSSPTQIASSSNKSWVSIAAGGSHTTAIASDYSLWAWGTNNIGQFGDSSTVSKSSPTQITTNTSSFTFVSAGPSNTHFIKFIGTMMGTGLAATTGQLGDNTTVTKSALTAVFTTTTTSPIIPIKLDTVKTSSWTQVSVGSAAVAISSEGTLWAWGTNTSGQVPDITTVSRSSPTQVGGQVITTNPSPVQLGTSWNMVSGGTTHTLGLSSDNTLWAWGSSPGNGQSVPTSSPVQIGTGNSWVDIHSGTDLSQAIDSQNGTRTLYAWGTNTNYQLGSANYLLGQVVSSPVQIGSLPGTDASAGAGNGGYIKNS